MKLNAEQIKKAFECCIKSERLGDCKDLGCPALTEHGCSFYLRTDDDYESAIYIEMLKDTLSLIKELTEENERVKLEYAGFEAGAKDAVSFVKADTVKKMHSEIKERCIKGGIYPAFVASTIDQIAKELSEGAK